MLKKYMQPLNVKVTAEELAEYDKKHNLNTAYKFADRMNFSNVPLEQVAEMKSILKNMDNVLAKCAIIGLPGIGKTTFTKLIKSAYTDLNIIDTDYAIEYDIFLAHEELIEFYKEEFEKSGKSWKDFYKTFSKTDYEISRHACTAKAISRYNALMETGNPTWLRLDGKAGNDETKIALLKEFNIPIIYVETIKWNEATNEYSNTQEKENKVLSIRSDREKSYEKNSDIKITRIENDPVATLKEIFTKLNEFNSNQK